MLTLAVAACSGKPASRPTTTRPQAVQQRQLTVDGQPRTYRLFVPPTLDLGRPSPLVLVLHGGGNTGASMVESTQFDREASDGGFFVAYPEGLDRTWNAGFCCGQAWANRVDDVGFLLGVIDDLARELPLDQGHVYAVGVSNGAMMAYRLACERADRVAGVGSVAGAMPTVSCTPSKAVSVIELHGTADQLVPYEGGLLPAGIGTEQPLPSATDLVSFWASRNNCRDQPASRTEGAATRTTWRGCNAGTAVELVRVDGGTHTWFATGLGPSNGAVDATHAIWEFLSANQRRG